MANKGGAGRAAASAHMVHKAELHQVGRVAEHIDLAEVAPDHGAFGFERHVLRHVLHRQVHLVADAVQLVEAQLARRALGAQGDAISINLAALSAKVVGHDVGADEVQRQDTRAIAFRQTPLLLAGRLALDPKDRVVRDLRHSRSASPPQWC